MKIEEFDIGDQVICDACGVDYTDSEESGGFLFCSKAYCPKCAKKSLPRIKGYGEEHYIRGYCPEGISFADWCRQLRGGDNTVRIISSDNFDDIRNIITSESESPDS